MKKIVFLSLFALCLPWTLVAQSIDDDLYYTPSKNKEEKKEEVKQEKKETSGMERSPELVHDTFGGFCIGTCFKKLCNYQCNGSDRVHGKHH